MWNCLEYKSLFDTLIGVGNGTVLPKSIKKICLIQLTLNIKYGRSNANEIYSYEMDGANETCCSVRRFASILSIIFAFNSIFICGISKLPIESVFEPL